MITVKEAQKLLIKNTYLLQAEEITLNNASGRILARDIQAPISHPMFDNSAVDGYAFRYNGLLNKKIQFSITGEVKAGDSPSIKLKEGETARIFTGAAIPEGANTVVMQEFVEKNGSFILIQDQKLKKGSNIRKMGEQIQKGNMAISKGTSLNPAGIGFLASLGIRSVKVSCLPKVAIIITGNEFAAAPLHSPPESEKRGIGETERRKTKRFTDSPIHRFTDSVRNSGGGDLGGAGKIYESNGQMLQSALKAMGINCKYQMCNDDPEKLTANIQKNADLNDIVIITGGVSVGKYDYTKTVLEKIGFKTIFHKVLQKPGKPILFSKKQYKIAFGLPGNPRSVMICFYEYVYPYINAIMGSSAPFLPSLMLPLSQDYEKKDDNKVHFLAARFIQNGIEILEGQFSHMLQSLSMADGLIVLPENKNRFKKGELVEVHLLSN